MAWKTGGEGIEPQETAGGGSLAADEVLDLGEELGGVAKAAVDGGEAQEGDFVELFELVEDLAADDGGGDFALVLGLDFSGDGVHQHVHLRVGDRPFDGGMLDRPAQLGAVEVFVAPIALQDAQDGFDHLFVGGEAVAALGAYAPAADDVAPADAAGVDHPVIGLGAFRTAHGRQIAKGGRGCQACWACSSFFSPRLHFRRRLVNMMSMDERDDQGMRIYLREIGQVVLTPDDEVRLARRIKKGDEAARQQMIRANLRLVVKIAGDYARLGLPLLDLISEGNLGLMKAVDRFDPKKGGKLSTYAAWWIKQGIRRALANQGKTIRLPSHMVDKLFRMRRMQETLAHELGRLPTARELAKRLDVPEKTVKYWMEVSQRPTSLDLPLGEDGRENLGDTISDTSLKSPVDELNDQQLLQEMAEYITQLGEREQLILKRRFGLEGVDSESLEEVGKRLGVTRERVRQLQNQALETLREKMLED